MSRAVAMMAGSAVDPIERMSAPRAPMLRAASPDAPRHLEALTSLRFFAALFVVIFHHGQAQFVSAPASLQNMIKGGFIGVPFFFILSGFILAYNYLPQAQARVLDTRQFWVARFARIYPVYAAALLLSAPPALLALLQSLPWEVAVVRFGLQGAACFGLLQAWIPDWSFAWNGPAWSLSVEAFFYLLFPFLAKGLTRRGRWIVLVGLASMAGVLGALGWLVPSWNLIPRLQGILGWANPLLWLPLFLLGVCAAEWHLRRPASGPQARAGWPAALTVGVGALMLGVLAENWQRHSQLLFCYGLALPCAALIVLLADRRNPIGRWLAGRTLVRLGEASFALYILHRPVAEWMRLLEGGVPGANLETAGGFLGYLALCLGLSLAAVKFLELPCRRWIKSRARGEQEPVGTAMAG